MYMSQKTIESSLNLTLGLFSINFPGDLYVLDLKLPLEIRISQLTLIIRNYTKLHESYGEKKEGRICKPMYLSTKQHNLILDWVFQSSYLHHEEFTTLLLGKSSKPKGKIQLAIEYIFENQLELETKNPIILYNIYGKIQFSPIHEQLVTRLKKNGKLYSIFRKHKSNMSFNEFEILISIKNNLEKWDKQKFEITPSYYQNFETKNYLNIVVEYLPVRLHRLKISERQQFETYIGQIARILHILIKQNIDVSEISLQGFGVNQENKILIIDILSLRQAKTFHSEYIKIDGQLGIYSKTLKDLWESLMKNCQLTIIQYYLVIYQYLLNGKISNYSQFIRYFQFGRKQQISPRDRAYLHNLQQQQKKKSIRRLLKNALPVEIKYLTAEEITQLSIYFEPRTNIFRSMHMVQNTQIILQKEIEDASTAKKPKYNYNQHRNKLKNALQNKSTKVKRNQSKISEFLIDDL